MGNPLGRQDPIRPGVSIAGEGRGAGSFGAWVRDAASGEWFLLSAWHVFADAVGTNGRRVLQPAELDGGTSNKSTVGTVVRAVHGASGDAAIARGTAGRGRSNQVFGSTVTLKGVRDPVKDEILHKFGRSTHATSAVVQFVGNVKTLHASCRGMVLVPVAGNGAPISSSGDSGAIWYDPKTGEGVGIHLEGNTPGMPEQATACSLADALAALEVVL